VANRLTRAFRALFGRDEAARSQLTDYVNTGFTFNGVGYWPPYGGQVRKNREEIENSFTGYVTGAYKSDGVVFATILARLLLFTEARFQWQHMLNGRPQDLFGDDALNVLENPWPNGTTGELLARMEQDVSLAGNFYAVRDGDRIRRLRPDWVSIVLTAPPEEAIASDVAGYAYYPGGITSGSTPEIYPVDEMCHWCADEETEILTAEGWKDFRALQVGDEVLTLNHQTGLSEWQPALDVMVFPAERRSLVSMEGREFSSLTTGNHRWAVERKNSRAGGYVRRWATSDSISTGDRIPIAAFCADTPAEQKWTDALVELVAWFWTEGRYKSGSKPGIRARGIQIAQSAKNADNVARIRASLTALFGPAVQAMSKRGPRSEQPHEWREAIDDDMLIFSLSANASDVVTEHAPSKVVTTGFLRSLTQAQLDLFIQVSMLADNNGADRLAQKNPAMAEQFALACILAGRPVSIRPGQEKLRGYRMTNVRMLKKRHVYPQESRRPNSTFTVSRVDYDGHVWCPRTQNETWLARRRGSVYFTGNSPIPDPEAQFRGMSWLTPVLQEVIGDKLATVHKNKFFENGATLQTVFLLKETVTGEQFKEFIRLADEAHVGVDNAYKPLYMGGGADAKVIGADLKQLDFKAVQGAQETRIAAAAGVPPIIVGLSEGLASATYSNYAMARRKFGDHWARPQWRSACAALQVLTDVPEDARLWYDDRDIAFLREDQKDAAEIGQIRASTINTYITAGFTPESAVAAVDGDDLTLLVHTGMVSVQLQPPGQGVPTDAAAGEVPGETPPPEQQAAEPTDADTQALNDALDQISSGASRSDDDAWRALDRERLHHYWTRDPEGLAKWVESPHPWTSLRNHLLKHVGPGRAERMAAEWFHEVMGFWPGSDTNRVVHGKPPRGQLVGPG